MLRNYIVIALRNLRKHRLYSAITIGGLAIGLAACLMLILFVRDELSYDKWLPNSERIAKVEVTFNAPGREPMQFGQSPGPVKAALEKDFSSDIERVVRVYSSGELVQSGDKLFSEQVAFVDDGFFDVFDIPIAEGQRDEVLSNNTSVLVSERIAEKYFGDASPIGKVLTVDKKVDYTVVGVMKDLPRNTHLKLDLVALFDTERYKERPWVAENWTSANTHAYVLFRSNAAMTRVESELPGFVNRNVTLEIPGFENMDLSKLVVFNFMPLRDIHLHARKPGYFKDGGDITTVITFSAIAALILLIACINFVNLATARSMARAREVAMRKVAGATRSQLISQFLGEAVLTALIALLVAIALVQLALGPYNSFVDKELALNLLSDPSLLALIVGLVAIVGLIGGTYPAIYLSRFRPAQVLKANQSSASGSTLTRNALVVFQFAVSIALIVSTGIVYGQTRYARNLDLGFESSNRLHIVGLADMPGDDSVMDTLKKEVASLPNVASVSLASDGPPLDSNNNTLLYPSPVPGEEKYIIEKLRVDAHFFEVYGIKPLAGRLFSEDFPTDVRNLPEDKTQEGTQSIVVNETFLAKVGAKTPQDAIGMVLWDTAGPGPENSTRVIRTTVIGVVPDLQMRSINFDITPMMFSLNDVDEGSFNVLAVNVNSGEMSATLASIEEIWTKLAPAIPLRTGFVDQALAAQYDSIEKRGHLFGVFALFAVVIACLGLFGLASFAAERRIKEIGVRKALGASVIDIVRLLMWQFSKPVLIANAIAWPIAFYVMNRWLSTFKYHLELTDPLLLCGLFGGAGVIAMAIAWATVAGQAARVARASPIHALRCE